MNKSQNNHSLCPTMSVCLFVITDMGKGSNCFIMSNKTCDKIKTLELNSVFIQLKLYLSKNKKITTIHSMLRRSKFYFSGKIYNNKCNFSILCCLELNLTDVLNYNVHKFKFWKTNVCQTRLLVCWESSVFFDNLGSISRCKVHFQVEGHVHGHHQFKLINHFRVHVMSSFSKAGMQTKA